MFIMFDDDKNKRIVENIKTTMAVERHFLSESEVNTLERCVRQEINVDDAINSIKTDILSRMV